MSAADEKQFPPPSGKIKTAGNKPVAIRSHCVGKVKFRSALRRLIEVLCLLISRSLSYKEKVISLI
jgi:hypothetical protein